MTTTIEVPTEFRERFARHVAEFDGDRMTFRRLGTVIDSLNFQIAGRYLLVWGDLGDAVYAWSERLRWAFLAGCDLNYFASKCQASEVGRPFMDWSAEEARRWIDRHVEDVSQDEDSTVADWLRRELEHLDRDEDLASQFAWYRWIGDGIDSRRYEYFWELGSIGQVIHLCCKLHLYALKMAVPV